MTRLLSELSGKKISFFCFILAIVARSMLLYDFFSFDTDMMIQGFAAKNLAEGHGLTLAQVHASDLSHIVYEPERGWPPGYSFLIAPFYWLFNKNIVAACLFASIAGAAFFIYVFRLVLKRLRLPAYIINILVLFSGFSIPDYIRDSVPTDLMTIAFCLLSCYIVMKMMANEKNMLANTILLGITTACTGWLRYMYIPISFVPCCFLIWNGWFRKNRLQMRAGLYSLAINSVMIGALLLFQQYYTGQPAHTLNPGRGFFPGNLLYMYPFPLSAFVNLNFYTVQLSSFSHFSYPDWMLAFKVPGALLLLLLIFLFLRYLIRTKIIAGNMDDTFFMLTGLISLVVIVVLCCLSLVVEKHRGPPINEDWTYVSDRRYYGFIEIVLLIAAAWWLFKYSNRRNILLKVLFFSIVGIEILHGAYVIAKYLKGEPSVKRALIKTAAIREPVKAIIYENHQRGIDVVFTSVSDTFCGDTWLAGANCLYNYKEINGKIAAARPTLLVLLVNDKARDYFRGFIGRKDVVKMKQIGEFYFYSCYIEPHAGR